MRPETIAIAFAGCAVALTGCAATPMQTADITAEELTTVSLSTLCSSYAVAPVSPRILDEIENRSVFTDEEIQAIREREVVIGMSEAALRCSWGSPQGIQTSSAGGRRYRFRRDDPVGVSTYVDVNYGTVARITTTGSTVTYCDRRTASGSFISCLK